VHMDMVFADNTFENTDVFCITDLNDEFSASDLNIIFENSVSVFGNPYDMSLYLTDCMSASSHLDILTHL